MGYASTLFYNPNNLEEQTLYRRIVTTDTQYTEQQERWNNLAEYLQDSLNELTGYPVSSWLQGSYKFGTQIKPIGTVEEFDIDLGIYFAWEGKPEDGKHTAKKLRGFIQDCLLAYKKENPDDVIEVVDPAKARCCRIRFKGEFHIDVPCYHLDPKQDKRMLATDDGWEVSDPKKFYLDFKNKFDDYRRAKVRRSIQYMKCWAALRFEDDTRPSSILLTVLIADAFKGLSDEQISADDEAFALVLEKIINRLDGSKEVPNPVNKAEDLAARMPEKSLNNFISKLRDLYSIAQTALSCQKKVDAADKWSEAFDHYFPMPQPEEVLNKSAGALVAYLPVNIKVSATSRSFNNGNPYEDINKLGPIPKNCNVYFEITNPEIIPAGASIQWTVRNEGEEAEYVNDLGHKIDSGSIKTMRNSAYKGTHYMDCVIKQYGRIIAFQRVPITISDTAMPRRNPVLRTSYTKLAGRRR